MTILHPLTAYLNGEIEYREFRMCQADDSEKGEATSREGALQSGVGAEAMKELRVRARLAWNNWPDNAQSREKIAEHEARDSYSARAWDRVIAAVRPSAIPINRNNGRPCDHAYVRLKGKSVECDLCGAFLGRPAAHSPNQIEEAERSGADEALPQEPRQPDTTNPPTDGGSDAS